MEKLITKLFGEIGIDEQKIINFPEGIIGFKNLKNFLLIHDSENEDSRVTWMQSIDEPAFAIPVIDPLVVKEDYNPIAEDELLACLGEITDNELFIMVTLKVPEDIKNMSVNLKAPLVINPNTRKGCQILVQNEDYMVKYPIYEILNNRKAGK